MFEMGSGSASSSSHAKRQTYSTFSKIGRSPIASSDQAVSIQGLKAEARRCQTPKQFRELLEHLRAFIPFQKFLGLWGYPSRTTIRFLFNQGFPRDLSRWRLTTGALWTSPLFQEWLRTKRTVLWCDEVKHLKAEFDPELLTRMKQANAFDALDVFERFSGAAPAISMREHARRHIDRWTIQIASKRRPCYPTR